MKKYELKEYYSIEEKRYYEKKKIKFLQTIEKIHNYFNEFTTHENRPINYIPQR